MNLFLRSLACLCLLGAILPANAKTTKANFPGAKAEVYKHASGDDLYFYQDQPHGFFNESKGGSDIFLDTLRKMDAFLVKIGYLEGSPTEKQLSAASKRRKTKL